MTQLISDHPEILKKIKKRKSQPMEKCKDSDSFWRTNPNEIRVSIPVDRIADLQVAMNEASKELYDSLYEPFALEVPPNLVDQVKGVLSPECKMMVPLKDGDEIEHIEITLDVEEYTDRKADLPLGFISQEGVSDLCVVGAKKLSGRWLHRFELAEDKLIEKDGVSGFEIDGHFSEVLDLEYTEPIPSYIKRDGKMFRKWGLRVFGRFQEHIMDRYPGNKYLGKVGGFPYKKTSPKSLPNIRMYGLQGQVVLFGSEADDFHDHYLGVTMPEKSYKLRVKELEKKDLWSVDVCVFPGECDNPKSFREEIEKAINHIKQEECKPFRIELPEIAYQNLIVSQYVDDSYVFQYGQDDDQDLADDMSIMFFGLKEDPTREASVLKVGDVLDLVHSKDFDCIKILGTKKDSEV